MASRLMTALLIGSFFLIKGCSRNPKPEVMDFDTYQEIQAGPVSYVTPDGLRVVESKPGFVRHEVAFIPDTEVIFKVDLAPPTSLDLDASRNLKDFVSTLPNGRSNSVQYHKVNESEIVRARVEAIKKDGSRLFGLLTMVRKDRNTATFQIVGPADKEVEITKLGEALTRAVVLEDKWR